MVKNVVHTNQYRRLKAKRDKIINCDICDDGPLMSAGGRKYCKPCQREIRRLLSREYDRGNKGAGTTQKVVEQMKNDKEHKWKKI